VPVDEELVRRGQAGDRAAVVALYNRYVNEIYGFAHHQIGDSSDAEDITSETFLRMVRALRSFRGESTFRTWLYSIARNQLRDHWRRNGRAAMVPIERPIEDEVTVPSPARPEITALGQSVLARLPDNYRRVLELRVMGDRSVRDTAQAMGTTEGNVKVLLHRALRRAAEIAEEIGESP